MPIFGLIAVIIFAVGFILRLVGESLGRFDLLFLGLFFVALHLTVGAGPWAWTRRPG